VLLANLGFLESPDCDGNSVVKWFAQRIQSSCDRNVTAACAVRSTSHPDRCRRAGGDFAGQVIQAVTTQASFSETRTFSVSERRCSMSLSPTVDQDSDEEGLQSGPEGGDGRQRMLLESLLQMSQRELRRAVRIDPRWLAQSGQRRSDGSLSVEKSSPDAIRGGIAQSAVELSKGVEFVFCVGGVIQEPPQAVGVEKQTFDFVGDPNGEGPSAASRLVSITAEDARGPHRFVPLMWLVAAQEAVFNEASHGLAVRARGDFEPGKKIIDFLPGRKDPATHDQLSPLGVSN
jgi:hypothetical protein